MAGSNPSPPETCVMAMGPDAVAAASRIIAEGGVVAVPTETVYGLATDATDADAVARIYAAKGRPSFNPLIVHVADRAMAEGFGAFDDGAMRLADAFWPGPLTIVVPRRPGCRIASIATAGLDTIALRCPAHPAMQAVIVATGRPLAAPSANVSGSISPTTAAHVLASLGGRIPLVIDAGPCGTGLESTIVRPLSDRVVVLREGPVTRAMLEAASGLPVVDDDSGSISAPGQLSSHYAPGKPVLLECMTAPHDAFHIGFGAVAGDYQLSAAGDLKQAAARLFDALHAGAASVRPRIAVAPVPRDDLGAAINDRLRRAAA